MRSFFVQLTNFEFCYYSQILFFIFNKKTLPLWFILKKKKLLKNNIMTDTTLQVYNSLTRKLENFEPLIPSFVGMYLCGPTVYGEPHLGHARPAVIFDVIFRYLQHLGYKVRYVRNITDVGHLEDDADEGEDKIAKKARLEKLEPMEIAQLYTHAYHQATHALNTLPPSIEPRATGHILEQIEMVQQLLNAGYAYEVEGNVYFDIQKYSEKYHYGKLSGRKVEELQESNRELDGQDLKRNKADFALWKKAEPEHIMRWNSPWGEGFPGWHLECSAMSSKYLGKTFDIHGGGMDLLFPHHECEIAQSVGCCDKEPVKYWLHNNMITINGKKMGKSLGNFITLNQFFEGAHPALSQAYTPATIRFFMLQAHYRSTLDFSNEGLQAAEKGYKRLIEANKLLQHIVGTDNEQNTLYDIQLTELIHESYKHLNNDFSTPQALASLFEIATKINAFANKQLPDNALNNNTISFLKKEFNILLFNILGLHPENTNGTDANLTEGLMQLIIELRAQARNSKNFAVSDQIRDRLATLNLQIKDGKEGTTWNKI